ncbi:MAG TPA: peptidoglycan-associated lipoprotein Pal [Gemmatimonadales bacterium]|nr:peptidoglycan-associated lipoprotein Pal [Gemmatimonadales bacterium]
MRVAHMVGLVAAAAIVAACGKKPEPEAVTPVADTAAANARARQDSIDAARRRAEEEAARRRAEEERLAGERAALKSDLTSAIHFDYDQAQVRGDDQANLDRKAAILQANPDVKVRIAGNADERGSDEYNLALGNRRAAAAKRYLQNKGIDAGRMEIVSYGEERPIAQGSDEAAYAQNRRDDFEVTAGNADSLAAPNR